MRKTYYRADRRCFKPGDVMLPECTYQNQFKHEGQAMERALEDVRPVGKPIRKHCLFVFEDSKEVERYWRTHDGSYLYEVEVDAIAILHCGDMELVDLIGAEHRKPTECPDADRVASLARAYWSEGRSTIPALEFLVPSAKVLAQLKGKSDTKAWVTSQITKHDPSKDPSIEKMLEIDISRAKSGWEGGKAE